MLNEFLDRYSSNDKIRALKKSFDSNHNILEIYESSIPLVEEYMWKDSINDAVLANYQALFQEYEAHIQTCDYDNKLRYKFIISIPVADRPQHLNICLQSIFNLCEKYKYGGMKNGVYNKVCVLISDDSQHTNNINKHIEITNTFTQQGLECIYFGQNQQKELLLSFDYKNVKNIIGDIKNDRSFHKGASITRNISYLKLQQLQSENEPCLFYFIDSDQEFKINIATPNGSENHYAINYFYQLNKIFTQSDISMLTGKVVGDPPVSPAVMAGTFLDDVNYFITKISALPPQQACHFHSHLNANPENNAAYHDMAELFGFKKITEHYDYQCTINNDNTHSNIDCLSNFSNQLNQFFDGEHQTRKNFYQHENIANSIKPARTIYTGNYIFKPENLKYFIPFANLKLRMAGPALGRIIKSELGDNFASTNLPMLHNRTIGTSGQSEFRTGVNHHHSSIDLSGEFIRQFFGDVMLFSIISLTEKNTPKISSCLETIEKTVNENFYSLKEKYIDKRGDIFDKITTLKNLLEKKEAWWNHSENTSQTLTNFNNFIYNIEFNFSENSLTYKTINSKKDINLNLNKIIKAISQYNNDRSHWQALLNKEITR